MKWPHGRKNGMLMMVLGSINDLVYFGCLTYDEEKQIRTILHQAIDRANADWDEYMNRKELEDGE